MTRYVLGFLFSQDETRIALIRKTRPAWQADRLNGIGGHVDEYETLNQAMLRESHEELGVHLTWRRFATVESHRFEDTATLLEERWVMACYRCQSHVPLNLLLPSRNDVGEAFETHDVHFLYDVGETVNNLHWLVQMALSRQERDWPFHVREAHHDA